MAVTPPRGIRNHNPGNLIDTGTAWDGLAAANERSPHNQAETKFCVFRAPWWGIRAMAKVLLRYHSHHNLKSVEKIIGRYAPGHENPTDRYIESVAQALGVSRGKPLTMDCRTLEAMITAMIIFENGHCPYGWEIVAGIILAGVEPKASVTDEGRLKYT